MSRRAWGRILACAILRHACLTILPRARASSRSSSRSRSACSSPRSTRRSSPPPCRPSSATSAASSTCPGSSPPTSSRRPPRRRCTASSATRSGASRCSRRRSSSSSPARCSSGAAQTLDELILFRALQGVGAGGLMVGAQAIIGDIVPPARARPLHGLHRLGLRGRRASPARCSAASSSTTSAGAGSSTSTCPIGIARAVRRRDAKLHLPAPHRAQAGRLAGLRAC